MLTRAPSNSDDNSQMTWGNLRGAAVWFNQGSIWRSSNTAGLCDRQWDVARAGLVRFSVENGEDVWSMVEAHTLPEDPINDLLGFVGG